MANEGGWYLKVMGCQRLLPFFDSAGEEQLGGVYTEGYTKWVGNI